VGPFDERYRWANDADWLVRAREAGVQIAMLDDSLVRYRVHDRNESRHERAILEESLEVLRNSVHRKRGARAMAERPAVSVLICVRDGQAYLADAIESALGQTTPPAEVIVVDDNSADHSPEVASSYAPRVRLVRPPPRGLGAARNVAVAAAFGDIVAFLDHDDIWEPHKLELQLEAFARDPALDFCFTHTREFAEAGDEERFAVRPEPLAGALASSLCARREAIERAGGFDIEVRIGEVLGWLLRARELGMRELTLPEVLVRRRIHANNLTRRERESLGDYARLLKASLDRRRKSA
jgi:glycosyltransferase involved in cell wall biosynthesis